MDRKPDVVQGAYQPWAETKSGVGPNSRYGAQNQGVMGKYLSRGLRALRSALQREREPFYAPSRRQIDAIWGWNGDSAAKVVHIRYTGYRFSAAPGACRIAIGSANREATSG